MENELTPDEFDELLGYLVGSEITEAAKKLCNYARRIKSELRPDIAQHIAQNVKINHEGGRKVCSRNGDILNEYRTEIKFGAAGNFKNYEEAEKTLLHKMRHVIRESLI